MQWNTTYIIVVTAIVSSFGTMLAKKLWNDLIPKGLIFTPKRILIPFGAVVTALALWKFLKIATGDEPITATMAGLFLANLGITLWFALAGRIQLWRTNRRIDAIEHHLLSVSEK